MVEYDDEEKDYEDAEYEEESAVATSGGANRILAEKLILVVLIVLSIGGVAISDFSTGFGLKYWLAVVPAFTLASIFVSWKGERARGLSVLRILSWQIMHWLPMALAIYLVFFLEDSGQLNREDAGLVSLLLLTVTTLSAGVHFDWRIFVVGLLLGVVTACVAFVEEFVWVLVVAALIAGVVLYFWPRRKDRGESVAID
jgi:hypothetical protein